MLKEEFETWPADLFPNATLITVGMHVTNLGYLKNRSLHFTESLDSNTEELNKILVRLDTAIVILETDNRDLLDLIDLKAKQANKKKEKAKSC